MRKTLVFAVLLGALVFAALLWKRFNVTPLVVDTAPAVTGEVRATVSNTRAGTIDACSRARMAPIMSGQIAAIPIEEGDTVKHGQILLELWNADLRAQLTLAENEKTAAEARADEACIAAGVARREAIRFESLRLRELTSEERTDAVAGEAKSREAACRAMRSMIDVSEARIKMAQAQLERTFVRAPFNGTVAEINGEVGEIVTPSPVGVATLPAVDLIDNSCIYISAPIDEVDAPDIRAGMTARISLDAFPGKTFPAVVRRVAPYVLAIEKQARTIDIEAELDEPPDNLLPGYSADIEVTIDSHKDVLHIPTQAIVGTNKVFVLDASGVLQEREITTGLSNWQVTEVIDGVSENENIVLSVDREGVQAGAIASSSAGAE